MAKVEIKASDGTLITIDGSVEEINRIVELYKSKPLAKDGDSKVKKQNSVKKKEENSDNLTQIINKIKECDEAEKIETNILNPTSQVNKILLPLYIIYKYFDNSISLQSGDINKITKQLNVPIATPNISNVLSGSGSRYVTGDKVRRLGQPVKYKLIRRGYQYFESILNSK